MRKALGIFFVLVSAAFGVAPTHSEPRDQFCENQNSVDPACDPFKWIDVVITPGPVEQFVYRPHVKNPLGADREPSSIELSELPLGYVSSALGPHPTNTEPRTYWLRTIQNLSSRTHTVSYCTSGHTETICLTNSATARYEIAAGQTLLLDDPASQLPRANAAFPPYPANRNNDYTLTSAQAPHLRGLVIMRYYNCADGSVNTCSS